MHTTLLWIDEKTIIKLKIIKIFKKVLTSEKKYDIINTVAKGN